MQSGVTLFTSLSLHLLTYKMKGSLPGLPCKQSTRTEAVAMEGHREVVFFSLARLEPSDQETLGEGTPRLCLMAPTGNENPMIWGALPHD